MHFIVQFFLIFSYEVTLTHTDDEMVRIENNILNPHPFNFTMNPGYKICGEEIFLLIYVHSSPANYKRRIAIRETWSHMYKNMRAIFMLGDTTDETLKSLLKYEFSIYNDLVQENFLDSYRNLTYKGVMSLKWITTYCTNVKYLLKVDDDIVVDIFKVWRHLKKLDDYKLISNKTILCYVWNKPKPIRNVKSKWYLTKQEFEPNYFATYCSGSAFLLTLELAKEMYNVSKLTKFFWIDDYFVTGMLVRTLNVSFRNFNKFYVLHSPSVIDKFEIGTKIFGHVSGTAKYFYVIWNQIFKEQLKLLPKLPIELQNDLNLIDKEFWWTKDAFFYS